MGEFQWCINTDPPGKPPLHFVMGTRLSKLRGIFDLTFSKSVVAPVTNYDDIE